MDIGKIRYEIPMWLGGWKVKSVPANCVVRIKSRKQRFSSTKTHKALLSSTFTFLKKMLRKSEVWYQPTFTKRLRTCAFDLQMSQQNASNAF